jgi:hypothetical protein
MSQAEIQNTSQTLSRRSAIALAGTSAIAISAASTAIADATTNPDAELLALGVRLEPIIAEWIAEWRIDEQHREAWKAACLDADLPELDRDSISFDEYRERDLVRSMVHYIGKDEEDADTDEDGASIKWPRINGQLFRLCEDILSRRATSVAGLGVQARAASIYFEELWDSTDGAKPLAKRSFIESVCVFSGVVPVPMEKAALRGSPMPPPALTPPEPDPIFAAIERHRKAWAAYSEAALVADRLEAPTLHGKPAKPGHLEAEAEFDRANDETEEAVAALIDTSPTTIAGAGALLRHVSEHDGQGNTFDHDDEDGTTRPWTYWISENVAAALEKVNVRS